MNSESEWLTALREGRETTPMGNFTLHSIKDAAKRVFDTDRILIVDNMSEINIQLPSEVYNNLTFEKIDRFEYLCRPAGYYFSYTEYEPLQPIQILAELKDERDWLQALGVMGGFEGGKLVAYNHAIELLERLVKETI
ncbi:hypothetical protein KAMFAM_149 [Bacillus phage Kamfam]|nr:hypothetical protein OTK52_147 [Bacillus phage OTooleKemple52]AXQ67326.1 hypothetical protein KAMFAM_149 [Bacillus phage Kamfam]